MGFEGFPLAVAWELTLACNLRCRHCGSSAGEPRTDELSLEESLAICDQFPALLVQEVDFTGGEPLVRGDWDRIAGRLTGLGIRTQVITNGLALTTQTVARMRSVGVSAVGVSLDGPEATHDDIRVCPGLFRAALTGISRLQDAGIPVTVITTASQRNVSELPQLLEVLGRAGIERWQVQPIFPLGRTLEAADLSLTASGYRRLGQFLGEWVPARDATGVKIELADSCGYFHEFEIRDQLWRGCPAGRAAVGITSQGLVKGCLSLPDRWTEGNLREEDLWAIWFRPEAFSYTRRFGGEELGPNCLSCEMADLCRGGCSAMSVGSTDRFHDDPYCFRRLAKEGWADAALPCHRPEPAG